MKTILTLFIALGFISCTCSKRTMRYRSDIENFKQKDSMSIRITLKSISEQMIRLAENEYTESQIESKWFGNAPATIKDIKKTEERLEISLPSDYREFLLVSNGFRAFNEIEPTFLSIEKVDYLKNIDPELIEIWKSHGTLEIGLTLEKSIIIGGIKEEQSFLLIPPDSANSKWKYWKFASWIPGEESYVDLKDYLNRALDFMKEQEKE